jgi:hypothetical protein
MAASFYKWLFIPGMALVASFSLYKFGNVSKFPPGGVRGGHPFHVSVVEINHNATEKILEVTCKIFTDDFEKALTQNYKTRVDLINPPDRKAMDSLVKKYIFSNLTISTDGRPISFTYLGFEREEESVFSYVQAENISTVNKIDITNKLMYDMFDDQINIMHVIAGGERKSTRLDYPNSHVTINFQ